MAAPYTHTRIDLATDAIRLVILLRGVRPQPIKCEIFETYLHAVEGVPYEALSYVWGARQSADQIWVNDCPFDVTENLHEALTHLRRPDEDRVLWVDAICIDQRHEAVGDHGLNPIKVHQIRLTSSSGICAGAWPPGRPDAPCLSDCSKGHNLARI